MYTTNENDVKRKYYTFLLTIIILVFFTCNNRNEFQVYFGKKGGTFEILDDKSPLFNFRIVIPENTLTDSIEIQIQKTKPYELNSDIFATSGPAIEISFKDTLFEFAEDATISLPVNDSVLNIPVIGNFNETKNKWQFLKIEPSQSDHRILTFKTRSPGKYVPLSINAGGIKNVIHSVHSDIEQYLPEIKSKKYSESQGAKLKLQLKSNYDKALESMLAYSSQYETTLKKTPGVAIYNDLNSMIENTCKLIAEKNQNKDLLNLIINEVNDSSVTLLAIHSGNVIISAMPMEFLLNFWKDQETAQDFWINYFKAIFYNSLLSELENIYTYPVQLSFIKTIRPGINYDTTCYINENKIEISFKPMEPGNKSKLWTEFFLTFNYSEINVYGFTSHGPGMNQMGLWIENQLIEIPELITKDNIHFPACLKINVLKLNQDKSIEIKFDLLIKNKPREIKEVIAKLDDISAGDLVHIVFRIKDSQKEIDFSPTSPESVFIINNLNALKKKYFKVNYVIIEKDMGPALGWGENYIMEMEKITNIRNDDLQLKQWWKEVSQDKKLLKKCIANEQKYYENLWSY